MIHPTVQGGRGGCAICNELDHWKNECPLKGTTSDKKHMGNKVSNRAKKQGNGVNVDIGSNTLRALECQRCKAASKLTFCPGCRRSTGINHCLLHCEGFMVLSVKDRVDIVKSAKHCAICLHPSHTTDKCFNKDKDNHVCGVAGCTSHHHPVLHGSKDIYVTGVNTLLAQRLEALTTTGVPEFIPYDQWASRRQYSSDSYPADLDATVMLNANFGKSKREEEIEEVRSELAKPLIHGD